MARSATEYTKPLLIIGNGARGLDWTKFNLPIITTRLAIDLIPSGHPLFAGRYGLFTDKPSYLAIQNATFILAVGARLDPGFSGYNFKDFASNAYKMIVDIDKKELNKFQADNKICIDAKEFYRSNLNFFNKYADPGDWLDQIHTWQKKYPLKLTGSYKVIREISDQAKPDDIIVVDTSSSFHIAAQVWQIKKGQRYITTGGISTMGYWPAAIGASLASGKRVICITGDGCLQMNIQELATVVKNKLNIKIFVLNNNGYLLIRHTQKKYFHNVMGEGPKTGLGFPNFQKIADAYGIRFESDDWRVLNKTWKGKNSLPSAIATALAHDDPVLCELKTPYWEPLQGRIDELSKENSNQTY